LAYERFEVFTAVLLKIKVFCHWRIVTGVSKFVLPSAAGSKNACSCAGHRSLAHAQKKCRKALLTLWHTTFYNTWRTYKY